MSFFTQQDFGGMDFVQNRRQIVDTANALLQARGERLTGIISDKYTGKPRFIWNDSSIATHEALLICIEKLPKKPCDHESIGHITFHQNSNWLSTTCAQCGIKLKPKTWQPA